MPDLERDLELALERFDPVPAHLAPAAVAGFDRRVDAELAQLVFDSLTTTATTTATGARGSGQPRLLTFEGAALTIDLEVSPRRHERRLVVRLEPAQPTPYEVWAGDVRLSGTSDALGRFAVTLPAPGPFRVRCHSVITPWMSA
jgi:hypothetical protein